MIPLLYLTCEKHKGLLPEERELPEIFAGLGVLADVRVWDETDWRGYPNILIRTVWDYTAKEKLFLDKIAQAEADGATIIHSPEIVRWNIDKSYLVQLRRAGHDVVPTGLEVNFSPAVLAGYFEKYDTLIVKPRVGAGGKNTFKISKNSDAGALNPLLGSSVLVQPYIPEIANCGEHSFIFFNEQFSHAVLKKPGKGEFRVQEIHGGTVESYSPTGGEIEQAAAILKAAALNTVYARVDMVRRKTGLCLMELEILEPQLFFDFSDQAKTRFAQAVRQRIARHTLDLLPENWR